MNLHRPLFAASILIAVAPGVAGAAVTPDQAKSVEGQLQTWYATTFNKPAKPGARAVQVEPAGERYKISVPLGLMGTGSTPLAITALANPAENGRWIFDTLRLPQPFEYNMTIPQQRAPGQKETPGPLTMHSSIVAASQEGSGVWDPTFATPSTFKQTLTGVVSTSFTTGATAAEGISQRNTIESTVTEATMTPNGQDKVDIVSSGTLTGYGLKMETKEAGLVDVAAKSAEATIKLNGVSRERGVELVRAMSDLIASGVPGISASAKGATPGTAAGPTPEATPPAEQKLSPAGFAALRRIIVALPDMGNSGSVDESATGLKVVAGSKTFGAAKVGITMTVKSTAGVLQGAMGMSADGMAWPDFGLGDMAQLLPTHFVIRPTIAGVSGQDLYDLLLASVDAGQKGKSGPDDPALKNRLMTRGGTVGIEALEFDVAGTSMSGTGTITVQGGPGGVPRAQNGSAHIVAKDFDKVTAVLAAQPMLAQAMPAVVFMKGLAKQAEGGLVWDVTFDGTKLAVNGTDMTAMMGGAK